MKHNSPAIYDILTSRAQGNFGEDSSVLEERTLSLFEVSNRLGVSPSAIKKRVVQLGLPVRRGIRGKLLFDAATYGLLVQADQMLKAGDGFEECRQKLGLNGNLSEPISNPELSSHDVLEAQQEVPVSTDSELPPRPAFVRLRSKALSVATAPDLVSRLDAAFQMLESKERHNQMLQAKLLVAYEEITRLSAASAMLQERSSTLAQEVENLKGELKQLSEPETARSWWEFWRY